MTVYFSKVHCFAPILHKPRFLEEHINSESYLEMRTGRTPTKTLLTLHAMMALAARFCNHPYFAEKEPVEKGEKLGETAWALYHEKQRNMQTPDLEYLQGCTLLAYYSYLRGPDSRGWLLIGMCSRLAYDLELDKTDLMNESHGHGYKISVEQWSRLEECRRAWWSVWELDCFSSSIACRAHTIDKRKMHVRLPVSDERWFANTPVESVVMGPDPLHACHCLKDCPNQDERAWHVIVNFLLIVALDFRTRTFPRFASNHRYRECTRMLCHAVATTISLGLRGRCIFLRYRELC